jgi:hypothetical protein
VQAVQHRGYAFRRPLKPPRRTIELQIRLGPLGRRTPSPIEVSWTPKRKRDEVTACRLLCLADTARLFGINICGCANSSGWLNFHFPHLEVK